MKNKLTLLDYFIIILILVITFGIGAYHGFKPKFKKRFKLIKNKTKTSECNDETSEYYETTDEVKEYLTANSSIGVLPIAFSLLATFFSSTSILGFSAEAYHYGLVFYSVLPTLIIMPAIGAFFTGPFFANLGVSSVFEYLEMRFNSLFVRQLAVICYLIKSLGGMSIFFLGPSITINALTGISVTWCIIGIGVISIICTAIGGIKGVIWTDLFQFVIMLSGVIAIIINGIIDIGGIKNLWNINYFGGRLNFFDFDLNPFIRQSFWSINLTSIFIIGSVYCIDQQMLQRFVSAKSKTTAKKALLLNSPGLVIWIGLCFLIGLIMYATYHDCDPLSAPSITGLKNPSQLISYYVNNKFKSLTGMFVGTIMAASLSSISSTLNSVSAILLYDILKRFNILKKFQQSTLILKILIFLFGTLCGLIALLLANLKGSLLQISNSILGSLEAPIIGIFILASLFKITNKYGAIIGMLSGLLVSFWLSIGVAIVDPIYKTLDVGIDCYINSSTVNYTIIVKNDTLYTKEAINVSGFNKIYSISYNYFGPFCVAVTVLVGISVSLFSKWFIKFEHVDDKYILYKWSKAKPSHEIVELTGN